MRLALKGQNESQISISDPLTRSFARPDIMDRNGRLLATDVELLSLYADPALIIDKDEAVERLRQIFPDLNGSELRRAFAERGRRFEWIRRGLSPRTAQRVFELGLPGLEFRSELKRTYPLGRLAGHVIGTVNIDNRGLTGIERYIDESLGIESVLGTPLGGKPPLRLSLDLGVQHGLEHELGDAIERYGARGAAGVMLDVDTGAVVAAASLPELDPSRLTETLDPARADKLAAGTFELGSIMKAVTVAMALESGVATLDKVYDVRAPLTHGAYTIRDPHPQGRPLSVRDIFVHSSNVGAARIALDAGKDRQRAFMERLGLLTPTRTEAGALAPPSYPQRWGDLETITIAYGHGYAVAPLQFAAAAASLVNGGWAITPTFLERETIGERRRVMRAETSQRIVDLMRRNVVHPQGTGRRAAVAGLSLGGKTGTAEIAARGAYDKAAVISSFLAVFPADRPRYLLLLLLFQPKATTETDGKITAGLNAAPAAGRLIARVAPLLGFLPQPGEPASGGESEFDPRPAAQ